MMLTAASALNMEFGEINPVKGLQILNLELSERADQGGILVSVTDDDPAMVKKVGIALGIALPVQHGAISGDVECPKIWLSPRSWLVVCAPQEEGALCEKISAEFPDRAAYATRFSDYLCWLELTGPAAEEALKQGSFVSFKDAGLAPGQAKRTLIAGVSAVLLRVADETWRIGVERSRADYFCNWLCSLTA